jgi:chromosome segregation ATPase
MEAAMDEWTHAGQAAGSADRDPEIALLRERIEVLTENLARMSDTMGELGAMRASLAGMHRRIDELGSRPAADTATAAPDGVFDAIERLRADVEALRADVARAASPGATQGLVQGLAEVRQAIAGLKNQMRTLDAAIATGLRSTTARWDGEARALAGKIDDVSRLFAAHAEAHRHSLQERATEWARIAGTLVETELRRLSERLPQPERVLRALRVRRLVPDAPWRLLGR